MKIFTRFFGLQNLDFHGKWGQESPKCRRHSRIRLQIGRHAMKFTRRITSNPKIRERMSADDNPGLNEPLQGLRLQPLPRSPLLNTLFAQSPKPILLNLPAQTFEPSSRQQFRPQTLEDRSDRVAKAPPAFFRPCCMHSAAVRASPTFHPKPLLKTFEIPRHITVPPESPASAFRAPFRLWPFEPFFFLKNFLDRNIQIQDHKNVFRHTGLFFEGRQAPNRFAAGGKGPPFFRLFQL